MTLDTQEMILSELRDFRRQVEPWMLQVEGRVSTLESNVDNSNLAKDDVEERLKGIEKWLWRAAGAGSAVTLLGGILCFAVKFYYHLF